MTRSMRRSLCAGMLVLQGIVLFLTGLVTIGMTDLGATTSVAIGAGLAALCLLAAGLLGRPGGYALGWAVQAVSVGLGLVVGVMFFLGVVFTALWAASYFLGGTIDEERAERAAAEQEWRAQHGAADREPGAQPDARPDVQPIRGQGTEA